MKCNNCQSEVDEKNTFCTNCGQKIKENTVDKSKLTKEELIDLLNEMEVKVNRDGSLEFEDDEEEDKEEPKEDSSTPYYPIWAFVCAFVPILGFALFILFKSANKKKDSTSALIGGIIGLLLIVVEIIIVTIIASN